jgi:hypothetical protein
MTSIAISQRTPSQLLGNLVLSVSITTARKAGAKAFS